jgi:hypothetical protein
MENSLGDLLLRECLVFIADILIFSRTFEDHLIRLENVFRRLSDHGFKLKASKCESLKMSVTYLGHVISEHGVATDPENIIVIVNWPIPTNISQFRSFHGTAGFYRRFIKNNSKIAHPLNKLLDCHGITKSKATIKGKKSISPVPRTWSVDQ